MNKHSSEAIQNWLISYLAKELKVSPEKVPLDEQLVDLGLTSRQAITMTGRLEDYLGSRVDASLVWDHPTVRQLAEHLAHAP